MSYTSSHQVKFCVRVTYVVNLRDSDSDKPRLLTNSPLRESINWKGRIILWNVKYYVNDAVMILPKGLLNTHTHTHYPCALTVTERKWVDKLEHAPLEFPPLWWNELSHEDWYSSQWNEQESRAQSGILWSGGTKVFISIRYVKIFFFTFTL